MAEAESSNWNRLIGRAVGIQSGAIPDSHFSASSCHGYWYCWAYGPQWGRLHWTTYYGGWLANGGGAGEWYQVDLGRVTELGGFATQGCYHGNHLRQYTLTYTVDGSTWHTYRDSHGQSNLLGNWDGNSVRRHIFSKPFSARIVRITNAENVSWACLRTEFYVPSGEQWEMGEPLGISTGRIGDSSFRASSAHGNNWHYHGPQHSRLYGGGPWGGWIPQFNRAGEWIEVDLGQQIEVGKIALQGRRTGPYWVTAYSISYSSDGSTYTTYEENGKTELGGVQNEPDTPVERQFSPSFFARYVRLTVQKFYNGWPVLRWELYSPDPVNVRPGRPFGVQDGGAIQDSALSASSAHGSNWWYYGPRNGRLFGGNDYGCYLPASNSPGEWMQADLGNSQAIGAVATQGRSHGSYWLKAYTVAYSDDASTWTPIMKDGQTQVFQANADANTVVTNLFDTPVVARYIRVIARDFQSWPCFRMEVYSPHASWVNEGDLQTVGTGIGVEDGSIPDSGMTASTFYFTEEGACAPRYGRLRGKAGAGAWCAKDNDSKQWLQIETDGTIDIGGFGTQGRNTNSDLYKGANQFVTSYKVSFSNDGQNFSFLRNKANTVDLHFQGNRDNESVQRNAVPVPFKAKFVRFHPMGWFSHISMRVELYDTAARQAAIRAAAEAKRKAEEAAAEAARVALAAKLAQEEADRQAKEAAEKAAREKAEREALLAKREAEKAKDLSDKKKAEEDLAAAQKRSAELDAEAKKLEEEKTAAENAIKEKLEGLDKRVRDLQAKLEAEKFEESSYALAQQDLLRVENQIAEAKTRAIKEKMEGDEYRAEAESKKTRLAKLIQEVSKFSGNAQEILQAANITLPSSGSGSGSGSASGSGSGSGSGTNVIDASVDPSKATGASSSGPGSGGVSGTMAAPANADPKNPPNAPSAPVPTEADKKMAQAALAEASGAGSSTGSATHIVSK